MQRSARVRMPGHNRLGTKILMVMGGVLIAASIASLALLVPVYRQELLAERHMVSSKLGAMLQITLENAMLKRDIEGLRDIVDRLGRSQDVTGVMILNPEGEVRFSSRPEHLGRSFGGVGEVCPGCALTGRKAETGTTFVRDDAGDTVLRSVHVVANREPCAVCHGPVAENPVNGLLVVDFNAGDLERRAAITAVLLGIVGILVVFGALGATWLALRRLVFVPVAHLTGASRALAAGDLSARAAVEGAGAGDGDEMVTLGRQFDAMAARIEDIVATIGDRDEFLQALIDAVPDGIRVIKTDFSVFAANAAFAAQVGIPLREVLNRPCYASSHRRGEPCVPTMVVCPLVELTAGGDRVKCMHTHVDARGGQIAVEVFAAALHLPTRDGPRRYVVESIRDLTRAVEVSQEQRLSEIGLLATGVAHEIHNPLASIRLGLGAIRRGVRAGELTDAITQYLGMIDTEIDRCIEVTERLMWLSQPPGERGELVDLDKVVHDVVALLQYDADVRGLTVATAVPPSARIVANGREIGMVLLNLIQNAFHACRAGDRVTVSAELDAAGDVRITVADSGVGIAPADLDRIFQPFWSRRADGSTGSGLGLAICKTLVTKWKGRIEVDSTLGTGTSFRLVFAHADKDTATGGDHG